MCGLALRGRQVLPCVVGGQVELAGAARDVDAAADGHEPVIGRQGLARFACHLVQAVVGHVDAGDDLVQHSLMDGRVAAVAFELMFVAVQLFEQVAFQIGPRGHIHDLEQGGQGVVMINGSFAPHQRAHALEQVFKAQHGAHAFVEGVFVEDQQAT